MIRLCGVNNMSKFKKIIWLFLITFEIKLYIQFERSENITGTMGLSRVNSKSSTAEIEEKMLVRFQFDFEFMDTSGHQKIILVLIE